MNNPTTLKPCPMKPDIVCALGGSDHCEIKDCKYNTSFTSEENAQ